ncbi:MAG: FAD-dependent oxidoreductase [Alphaproteobacteria bacterium]
MSDERQADLCVIGGGSAGLSVAAGAAQMGAATVLIERGVMGGDCLNTGCVPSKSLIAAARAVHDMRGADRFGIIVGEPQVDFARVHDHVHGVIAAIAPHDSVERFRGLGVDVIQAEARFVDGRTVEAGGRRIRARRFVIATGSRPLVPPVPGLDAVPYLTNESVFDLIDLPRHLLVIGGGPIGLELAQAFRRLGARVSVFEMASIMPKDDPEAVDVVRRHLIAEGSERIEQSRVTGVAGEAGAVRLRTERDGQTREIVGSHILVAAGRQPAFGSLNLEAAGVAATGRGITVNAGLRTSNRRVYAIGDAAGGLQFTHVAGYHAGLVLRSALFRLPVRVSTHALPWVTYSDPELAHVGLIEAAARQAHGDHVRVLRWAFGENDRAQTERDTHGLVKVVVGRRGRILGATIVGPHAGELIQPWTLAMANALKIGAMANVVAPYPTRGEASKRAAGSYYTDALFSHRTRRLVRFLSRFG